MNIRELADQAGLDWHRGWPVGDDEPNLFAVFADLVAALAAAHEREECAKIAEDKNTYYSTDCGIDVATDIADAIRARGKA